MLRRVAIGIVLLSVAEVRADDEDEFSVEDVAESTSPLQRDGDIQPEDVFETQFLPWMQAGINEAGLAGEWQRPLLETFGSRKGTFGQTLFAKRRMERGDILAVIPSTRFKKGSWHSLAVFLAKQRNKGEKSPFAPFVSVLPRQFEDRPANWDADFLHKHMPGSGFPEHVKAHMQQIRSDYDALPTGELSWEDYRRARDAVITRTMSARAGPAVGASHTMFFPLGDLMNHDDRQNVRCYLEKSSDGEGDVLVFKAARRIHAGDELLNAYIHFNRYNGTNTWQSFDIWGFVTPKTRLMRKVGQLNVTQTSLAAAQAVVLGGGLITAKPRPFRLSNLEIKEDDGFVGYLRNAVGNTLEGWEHEAAAMLLGKVLVMQALAAFPTSPEQDEELLAAQHKDDRVPLLIALRRDEKIVLRWWQKRFEQAEKRARSSSGQVDLNYIFAPQLIGTLDDMLLTSAVWADSLKEDFDDAIEQPNALALMIAGGHMVLLYLYCGLRLLLNTCCNAPKATYVAILAASMPFYLIWIVAFVLDETQVLYVRNDHRSFIERVLIIFRYVVDHGGAVVLIGSFLQLILSLSLAKALHSTFKSPKKKKKHQKKLNPSSETPTNVKKKDS